jgi:hypothetical protein
MRARGRCTFCDTPAAEWHHVAGRNHCSWFLVPLCTVHHRLITRAYYNAAPALMKTVSSVEERIKQARDACHIFLWLLNHPEQIDPERILE